MTARYFIECESTHMDLKSAARDIASGEIVDFAKIIAVEDGRAWDVTADIAEEVFEICMEQYNEVPLRLRDWVDEHYGLRAEVA